MWFAFAKAICRHCEAHHELDPARLDPGTSVAFGHEFLAFGHEFLAFGHEFLVFGHEFLAFGHEFFGLRPRIFGLRPRIFGLRPRIFGLRPRIFLAFGHEILSNTLVAQGQKFVAEG